MGVLKYIWQLPQCLIGLLLIKLYSCSKAETYKGINIYTNSTFKGGISLGKYILMKETNRAINYNHIKDHEYGHTVQSRILGPVYLLVIGIPSICWAGVRKISKKLKAKDYYSFYTEK